MEYLNVLKLVQNGISLFMFFTHRSELFKYNHHNFKNFG